MATGESARGTGILIHLFRNQTPGINFSLKIPHNVLFDLKILKMYNSLAKIPQSTDIMSNIPGCDRNQNVKPSESSRNTRHLMMSEEKAKLLKDKYILANCGYTVGRKIDSGTFAIVRYAERTDVNGTIPLAVKIIDKAKASPLFTSKFLLRELEFWPMLRHRHIVQVERMFQIQERIYVFMELCPRGSVIEYVQKHGAVEENVGRMWCKRMCQALRYCHKKGIAHRDLKCDNLLLDKDFQLKIGDFGFCCRSLEPRTGNPIFSDTYCGSSSYVAPEVIEGQPYDPISADIWSAGVCIYVMLNNSMPFDDSNITKMHEDQITGNWSFSENVKSPLSASVKNLIIRMLEPNPPDRPTMDQVLNCSWMRNR